MDKKEGNMALIIEAIYDGKVFHPSEPVTLRPNTRVKLVLETDDEAKQPPQSFLQVARSLNLEGPPDWARDLDAYLYGEKSIDED
jgi:predicted DNA-binding antitoxin AbrB/MazE fold protein